MLKISNFEVVGWEHAVRGMRNPKNSWHLSDSSFKAVTEIDILEDGVVKKQPVYYDALNIGPNDHKLMMQLRNGGTDDRKFMRMIVVYLDITAPFYWWKEYDTYKVGTVSNSCSTMHKLTAKEFEMDDFSHEHLISTIGESFESMDLMEKTVDLLNKYRDQYTIATQKLKRTDLTDAERKHTVAQQKRFWWQMIQLLGMNYNQKRTLMLNYEVLANIYKSRRHHKLDEWHMLCDWIEELPYSELITGVEHEVDDVSM